MFPSPAITAALERAHAADSPECLWCLCCRCGHESHHASREAALSARNAHEAACTVSISSLRRHRDAYCFWSALGRAGVRLDPWTRTATSGSGTAWP